MTEENEALRQLQSQITDYMDLVNDEFARIIALTKDTEIIGICQRAMMVVAQKEPVIKQRDDALAQVESLTKEHLDHQNWIDDLCAQLCKMEDALGFKNDCHTTTGAWVPTIGPWLDRVRDLIASEGELGDAKEQIASLTKERGDFEAVAKQHNELMSRLLKLTREHAAAVASCAVKHKALITVLDWDDKPGPPYNDEMLLAVRKAVSPNPGQPLLDKLNRYESALREISEHPTHAQEISQRISAIAFLALKL